MSSNDSSPLAQSSQTDAAIPNADIENQLHTANLLRLRGDLLRAEEACNAVLLAWPGQPDALVILGDVKSESGDWEDAIHWYSLALAENPEHPHLPEKLAQAQEALGEAESAAGAAQIGLPSRRAPSWVLPLVVGLIAVAVGLAAFMAGMHNASPTVYKEPISVPTETPAVSTAVPLDPTSGSPTNAQGSSAKGGPTDSGQESFKGSLGGDSPSSPGGANTPPTNADTNTIPLRYRSVQNIVDALDDPRIAVATLTLRSTDQKASVAMAPALATDLLEHYQDLKGITLRFVDAGGQPLYLADFNRESSSKALNEWFAAPESSPSP
jgi:hypothetical protein